MQKQIYLRFAEAAYFRRSQSTNKSRAKCKLVCDFAEAAYLRRSQSMNKPRANLYSAGLFDPVGIGGPQLLGVAGVHSAGCDPKMIYAQTCPQPHLILNAEFAALTGAVAGRSFAPNRDVYPNKPAAERMGLHERTCGTRDCSPPPRGGCGLPTSATSSLLHNISATTGGCGLPVATRPILPAVFYTKSIAQRLAGRSLGRRRPATPYSRARPSQAAAHSSPISAPHKKKSPCNRGTDNSR